MRVAAGHGDRQCDALCRDDLAGDPRLGRLVSLAGAHRLVEQPGAGRAGDAGCGAGLLQARGGGEGFWRRSWAAMQTAGAVVGRDRRGGSAMRVPGGPGGAVCRLVPSPDLVELLCTARCSLGSAAAERDSR